jgi:carboxypeptidase T
MHQWPQPPLKVQPVHLSTRYAPHKKDFLMKKLRLWSLCLSLLVALTLVTGVFSGSGDLPNNAPPSKFLDLPPIQGPFQDGEQPLEGDGPWVVRLYFSSREMVIALAQRIAPWEVNYDEGYLVVDVYREELQFALSLGFSFEVDEKLTQLLNIPLLPLEGQISGIPGYPCYRTVEETFATAEQIVQDYPHLAQWIDIGDSWEKLTPGGLPGYDLMVLILTNQNMTGDKAKLFIMSSVHAREYTPAELSTRYAEYLVQNYETDPEISWLLDHTEIHLLLQANPDGRKQAETGLSWRKNTNNNYCANTNSRGADLNRNYWFKWGCCGGSSGNPCDLTYRGPTPGSEPETIAVQNYVRSILPDQRGPGDFDPAPATATGIFLDMHSYSNLVLWPWGWTTTVAPNGPALQTLGRKFAYFNNYTPQQAVGLYPTDGSTDDFAYGELGLAAYTFELGTSFFQSCSFFENTIVPGNMPALVYAAKAARLPYMEPGGPDALNVMASPTAAQSGLPVEVTARIDDTRFNNSQGSEPVQNIAAAEYYINIPPWSTDPAPQAFSMAASDGSFNATIENVTAALDTTGLPEGRHIIYVRGRDAAGNWGPLSAAFLFIIDPQTSPVIEGYVRSSADNAPLGAVVSAGPFTSHSDPSTGFYQMYVAPGSYTVTASTEGYSSSSSASVDVGAGETLRMNFILTPTCSLFFDNVESGIQGWTAQTPWAITNLQSYSPTRSWTDSPAGSYGNNLNTSLTSQTFNFSAASGISLEFWHRYDLEAGYDYAYVEYSTNGGASWTQAAQYNGENQTAWRQETIPLLNLDGASNVKIRFRLYTDGSVTRDGWYIDDIRIAGGGDTCYQPLAPQADFAYTSPVEIGEAVSFVDLTVGSHPLTYLWDFGDGAGASTLSDPQYVYPQQGVYTVNLTVSNGAGSSSVSHQVIVGTETCRETSAVSIAQVSPGPILAGKPVSFSADITPGDVTKPIHYSISFGDGSVPLQGSSQEAPILFEHTYAHIGEYTLEVSAWSCDASASVVSSLVSQVNLDGSWLSPVLVEASGDPGAQVQHSFTITNTSGMPVSFVLSLGETEWDAQLSSVVIEDLQPGESEVVTVAVSIPAGALAGESDQVELTAAVPGLPFISASAAASTRANAVYVLAVEAPIQTLTLTPGSTVEYLVELTNAGNISESYTILYTSTWPTSILLSGEVLSSGGEVTLDAGEKLVMAVRVSIPAGAAGTENITQLEIIPASGAVLPHQLTLVTRSTFLNLYLPLVSHR